jgi:superfamily I DNA/RNA helicase
MFDHIRKNNISLLTPEGKNFFDEWEKAKKEGYSYPKDLLGKHDFWEKDIPDAMLKALEINPLGKFDRIIIDECQDLLIPGYLKIFDSLLKNGLKGGQWCMLGDYKQQSVRKFSDTELDENLAVFTEGNYFRQNLVTNCRNTKQISDKIVEITGFGTRKVRDGLGEGAFPEVEFISWKDIDEQRKCLENRIEILLKEIDKNDIIILSTQRYKDKSVISHVFSFPYSDFDITPTHEIHFSSIKKYKGLESPVVILVDIEDYNDKELLYQGMSRASAYLIILESESAQKQRLKITSSKGTSQ